MDAQDGFSGAVRAHRAFAHVIQHVHKLDAIERLIFPPQVFLSAGMIVGSQKCSICRKEYDDCAHVKGRVYMGRFCTVTLTPSRIDHVGIVENPADKRCRITKFSTEGGDRNRMSWRVEPTQTKKIDETQGITTEGVVATLSSFSE